MKRILIEKLEAWAKLASKNYIIRSQPKSLLKGLSKDNFFKLFSLM